MSAVVFRVVRTELERKCRLPGGKTVREAVADASSNLLGLGDSSMLLIAEGLGRIENLAGDGARRLPDAALDEIHRIADQLMGYCSTVERPRLAECLHTICRLVDAVAASEVWLPGTFGPIVLTAKLAMNGGLSDREVDVLLAGVEQCVARYEASCPSATSGEEPVAQVQIGRTTHFE